MDAFFEKIKRVCQEHLVAVCAGIVGILFLGYGLIISFSPHKASNGIIISSSEASNQNKSLASTSDKTARNSTTDKEIIIDIEGAVVKPGIYSLKTDSRIKDALVAAGGFSEKADKQAIAQNINLAAPLTDGAKLYLPAIGENVMMSTGVTTAHTGSAAVMGINSGQININVASESELDSLSGVGKITAQKIISNRPYKTTEELTEKKVVGKSVFEKIKNQISVY